MMVKDKRKHTFEKVGSFGDEQNNNVKQKKKKLNSI